MKAPSVIYARRPAPTSIASTIPCALLIERWRDKSDSSSCSIRSRSPSAFRYFLGRDAALVQRYRSTPPKHLAISSTFAHASARMRQPTMRIRAFHYGAICYGASVVRRSPRQAFRRCRRWLTLEFGVSRSDRAAAIRSQRQYRLQQFRQHVIMVMNEIFNVGAGLRQKLEQASPCLDALDDPSAHFRRHRCRRRRLARARRLDPGNLVGCLACTIYHKADIICSARREPSVNDDCHASAFPAYARYRKT